MSLVPTEDKPLTTRATVKDLVSHINDQKEINKVLQESVLESNKQLAIVKKQNEEMSKNMAQMTELMAQMQMVMKETKTKTLAMYNAPRGMAEELKTEEMEKDNRERFMAEFGGDFAAEMRKTGNSRLDKFKKSDAFDRAYKKKNFQDRELRQNPQTGEWEY